MNVVTEDVAEKMDRSSAELPPEDSEFDFADLERADSMCVASSRVAEAVIAMEYTEIESLEVKDRSVFFGEIETFHVANELLANGKIEMGSLDTFGRLGGPYYTGIERLELTRNF